MPSHAPAPAYTPAALLLAARIPSCPRTQLPLLTPRTRLSHPARTRAPSSSSHPRTQPAHPDPTPSPSYAILIPHHAGHTLTHEYVRLRGFAKSALFDVLRRPGRARTPPLLRMLRRACATGSLGPATVSPQPASAVACAYLPICTYTIVPSVSP
ncbi:hypothetical protein FIBSPDRAFT_1040169, partial [Athelia psychrophila]